MGGLQSAPLEQAFSSKAISPALLVERWRLAQPRIEVCKPDDALSFLKSFAIEMKIHTNEAKISTLVYECVDTVGNFRFGDLLILFHDALNSRNLVACSDLYEDINLVRGNALDLAESRNILAEDSTLDMHALPRSSSDLSAMLQDESHVSSSYFSLLPRDVLNNVHNYAQTIQIFSPQSVLKKRWMVPELVLYDASSVYIRNNHCVVMHDQSMLRDYLRILSLETSQCVWQSVPMRQPQRERSFCVSESGHIFVATKPTEITAFMPPYRNPVRRFAIANTTTKVPMLRAAGSNLFALLDHGKRYEIHTVLGMERPNFAAWSLSSPVTIRSPYQGEETVNFFLSVSETHGTVVLVHSFYFMIVVLLSRPERPHTVIQLNREQHPNPLVVASYLVFADTGYVTVYSLDDLSSPLKRINMLPSPSERGFIRLGRLPFARIGAFYSSPFQNNAFLSLSLDKEETEHRDLSRIDLRTSFPSWLLNGDTLMIESCGQMHWVSLRTGQPLKHAEQISTSSTSLTSMFVLRDSLYTTGLMRLTCWEATQRNK